jgi:hypothetical protein
MKENQHISKKIITELKKYGLVIQMYEASTSNSIYLKLDYGIAGSIRISDHHSHKAEFPYRYNILKYFSEPMEIATLSGQKQFFYSWKDVNLLIEHILKERLVRRKTNGIYQYNALMYKSRADNKRKAGFWRTCKEV